MYFYHFLKRKKKPNLWVSLILCVCTYMRVYSLHAMLSLRNHRLEIANPSKGLVFTEALEHLKKKL